MNTRVTSTERRVRFYRQYSIFLANSARLNVIELKRVKRIRNPILINRTAHVEINIKKYQNLYLIFQSLQRRTNDVSFNVTLFHNCRVDYEQLV